MEGPRVSFFDNFLSSLPSINARGVAIDVCYEAFTIEFWIQKQSCEKTKVILFDLLQQKFTWLTINCLYVIFSLQVWFIKYIKHNYKN